VSFSGHGAIGSERLPRAIRLCRQKTQAFPGSRDGDERALTQMALCFQAPNGFQVPNKESCMASGVVQDVRFAFRQLRKFPAFTVTAVLTLALGIGANAAIFTLVNAVLMRKLPVADPASLVRLGDNDDCCVGSGGIPDNDSYALFSTNTWQQLRKNLPEFQELAAMESGFTYRPVTARRDGTQEAARSMMGEFVSGNYFRTFGLRPEAGRLFADSDDNQGAPMVAILSYQNWHDNYAGDPSVVGSTFWINTRPIQIIGIAPQGFYGDRLTSTPPDYYLPIQSMDTILGVDYVPDPNTRWIYIIGRLRPGVALAPLQAKVNGLFRQIVAAEPAYASDQGKASLARAHIVLTPAGGGIQNLQGQYKSNLHMLMWTSALVLLIACANIANLLLVRGMSRRAEMSLRVALGAARRRVIRQLITESILLAGLSGVAGLLIAWLGSRALLTMAFPGDQNVPIDASPSLPVLLFACGLCLVTGILFGIMPAWMAARTQPADVLRSATRTTTARASLLQRSLVVVQAALSLVLLIGAGLFAESLTRLQSSDLKLDVRNRYIIHINPQAAGYPGSKIGALYQAFDDRFHAIPGVVRVAWATYTPMEDNNWGSGFKVEGRLNNSFGASTVHVSPEYFDSVGTRVLRGRAFTQQDSPASASVIVVNRTLVKDEFPAGTDPIGKHIGFAGASAPLEFQIVGVVDDTTYTAVQWKDHPMVFTPILQRPLSNKGPIDTDSSLYAGAIVVETAHPMPEMESIARRTLASINPNLAIVKFQTFQQQIADRFTEERMIARLTQLFGALALLLATIGLYGVTAYTVARQTGEIGIRMALGARRVRVVAMILRGALIQIVLGLAIGIPAAYFCVRYVESQLYEVKGVSPVLLAVAIGTLVFAAVIAGLIPARRAASIDPAEVLRME
jgi:macrolide transport system ATP-binding/permease protein